VAKLGIVEQELDETLLWFELLGESTIVPEARLAPLHQEADELLRIIVASIRSSKRADRESSP
jgi:four helix bundle protein